MQQQPQATKFDVQSILHLVKRRKWFLIIPLVLASFGGYIRIITLVSEYQAAVTLSIDKNNQLTGSLQSVLPGGRDRNRVDFLSNRDGIRKQFASIPLMKEVIRRSGFRPSEKDYEKAERMLEVMPKLSLDEAALNVLAMRLRDRIVVDFPRRGTFIEVKVTTNDPERSYLIVKHATDVFIEQNLLNERMNSEETMRFTNAQIRVHKAALDRAEDELRRYLQRTPPESGETITVTAQNIAQVQAQVATFNVDISNKIKEVSDQDKLLGRQSGELRINRTNRMTELKAEIMEKTADAAKLMINHTWNSGDVLRMRSEIATARDLLVEEIRTRGVAHLQGVFSAEAIETAIKREMTQFDIELLRVQRDTLNRLLTVYNSGANRMSEHEINLQKLRAEVEKHRNLYQIFLQQATSAEINHALQEVNNEIQFKILEPAQVPIEPINANANQVIILSLALGLGFGGGFIYLLEFIDQSFKSVDDVENYLGLIVLGTVPKINFEERMTGKKKRFSLF